MTIRITGLASGLDTESLVSELVSAYKYKKDNYVKAQTKLSWKQDAWKSLNTKIYSLYNSISNLRYSSAYTLKTTSISDSTKASITASSAAVNGTQTLKVNQLATAGYLTGGKVSTNDGSALTTSTKMSQLGFTGTGSINCNGKDISVSENETVDDVLTKLKGAGVNASLDTTNNRIFVSSKDSGASNEFTLTASDSNGASALYSLGLSTSSESATAYYTSALSKYAVFTGNDAEGNPTTFDPADYNVKYDSTEGYYLADADGNKVAFYNETATKTKVKGLIADGTLKASSYADSGYSNAVKAYNYAKTLQSGDTTVMDAYAGYKAAQTTVGLIEETQYNHTLYNSLNTMTQDDLKNVWYDHSTGKQVKITESTDESGTVYKDSLGNTLTKDEFGNFNAYDDDGTISYTYLRGDNELDVQQGYLDSARDGAGITADEYDAALTTISNFTKTYGSDLTAISSVYDAYQKTIAPEGGTAEDAAALTSLMESSLETAASYVDTSMKSNMDMLRENGMAVNSDAVRVDGKDAEIVLNGATFTGSSNTFNINGLTITAQSTTATGETLSITTSTDTQGIYDKVKDFLSQYNDLINEMTSLYNASSAKGYEPLTSEEKDSMTDTQIEEWEAKVKASLLRRDSTLSGVMNGMTTSMSSAYIMGKNSSGVLVNFTENKDGTYKGDDGLTYTKTSQDGGKYVMTATDGSTVSAKNYTWSSFGISTLGYLNADENQYSSYHIDGDADDESTSSKKDKLMAAINSDPDSVIAFLKNATSSLYDSINAKMGSTNLSSIYKVYNDKEMAQEYSDYTDTISDWEDKISDIEDTYYKKFAAMESALASLQSQSSSLSSLLS